MKKEDLKAGEVYYCDASMKHIFLCKEDGNTDKMMGIYDNSKRFGNGWRFSYK